MILYKKSNSLLTTLKEFISFILLWNFVKKYKVSFFLGAFCVAIFIFLLWVAQLVEGRGPYLDRSDLIVRLGFPDGLLYETLNLPLRRSGIDIPFFPVWMIVGGYITMSIRVILPIVIKKSYLFGKKLWYDCIDYIIIKRIKTKK